MRAAPALLLFLVAAGCAAPAGAPPEVLERSVRLGPRGAPTAAVEVNLDMTEGAEVAWRFDASAPLAWDVHTHRGRDVVTLANGTDAEASGTFRAPGAGVYSLYLRNLDPARTVDATVRVEGAFASAEPRPA